MNNRNILLIVDLQKDFIDGSLAVSSAPAIIPVINELKGRFDLVYFTLDWHPLDHCSFRQQGGIWPSHCVQHTSGASLPDSVLEGLDPKNIRYILKGYTQSREEYGALEGVEAASQDYFHAGDHVVVCGIAAEYCVLETLKNVHRLSHEVGFDLEVCLPAVAAFASPDTLIEYMQEQDIPKYEI